MRARLKKGANANKNLNLMTRRRVNHLYDVIDTISYLSDQSIHNELPLRNCDA